MEPSVNHTCQQLGRVMLVDDDATDNLVHRRVLERSGLVTEVIEFEHGEDALDYLQSAGDAIDLLFVDINMPRMNGLQFLNAFDLLDRTSVGEPLVVLLSTSINPIEIGKCAERFPDLRTVEKPLNQLKLERLIRDDFGTVSMQ